MGQPESTGRLQDPGAGRQGLRTLETYLGLLAEDGELRHERVCDIRAAENGYPKRRMYGTLGASTDSSSLLDSQVAR